MRQPASQHECDAFLNPKLRKPPVGWRFVDAEGDLPAGFVWDIEATKARHEGELARLARANGQ